MTTTMMMNKPLHYLLILLAVIASSTHAFVPNFATPAPLCTSSATRTRTLLFASAPENLPSDDETEFMLTPSLALKMAGILTIKTAKDVVNYPPMFLDRLTREANGKDQTNPFAMLFKFMGVLVFKVAHDAVYFPMLWTQRMVECQSLEECDLDDQ